MEDIEGSEEKKQKFSEEDINAGVGVVKEFMQAFAVSAQESDEYDALMTTYKTYKDRIEGSRWAQYVIESL